MKSGKSDEMKNIWRCGDRSGLSIPQHYGCIVGNVDARILTRKPFSLFSNCPS